MSGDASRRVRMHCPLQAGEAAVTVSLRGAGLREYLHGDRAIVPLDTETARTQWFSGVTLAPWPNRLDGGAWEFDGRRLQGVRNDDLGHALHGLVFDVDFEITAQTPDSVQLTHLLGADAVYPFRVRIDVTYQVTPRGLLGRISATNLDERAVPIALGAHPYLPYTDDCTLTIAAARITESQPNKIPSGRLVGTDRVGVESGVPARLGDLALDDCFTELERDATGMAHAYVTYPDGVVVDVWQDTTLPYTMVFTTRDFPWSGRAEHAIGIEPQSAPANALVSGVDLHTLQPAATWQVHWGVGLASPTEPPN